MQRFSVSVLGEASSKTGGRQSGWEIVTHSKSLGRVHQINLVRNAKTQDKRVKKAVGVLSKIKTLPIPRHHKDHFIQSHAHSKWVFGTETQGISVGLSCHHWIAQGSKEKLLS